MAAESSLELLKKELEAIAEDLEKLDQLVAGEVTLSEEELWDLGVEDPDAPLASWVQNAVYDIKREDGDYRLLLAGGGPTIWLVVDPSGACRLEGSWGFDQVEEYLGLARLGLEIRDYLDEVVPVQE